MTQTQNKHLRINAWPSKDRPRERLLVAGAAALSDAELVAVFLRIGVAGQSAVDLARSLLLRFGSLRALLDAPAHEMRAMRGVGSAKIAQFHAVSEIVRRALTEQPRNTPLLNSPNQVRDYLKLLIGTRPYEVFICLFLDAQHCLIRVEEIARGTLTQAVIYPREIARQALLLNAAGLIVAHNHPSGSVQPSAADQALTQALKTTLELIDVKLLDHFVVVANAVFSFAEHGLI